MLTIETLIRMTVEELQYKALWVPIAETFGPLYAECECDKDAIGLTHIMLKIIPVPAHVDASGEQRYIEVVGYKLPAPFKSSQIIKRGTKEDITAYLDDAETAVKRIMEVIPRLASNLMDV